MKYDIIPVTQYQQNCTLFWCPKSLEGVIIDPGGELDRILTIVKKHRVKLVKILLTHGHWDHAGETQNLANQLKLPIVGPHHDDAFWLEGMEELAPQFGFHNTRNCHPTEWLTDGDTIHFGYETLEVIHCPGHTPGHVVFFNRKSKIMQVGDVIFAGGIGRTDFPKGNHADLLHSIKTKLFPLGNISFIPGHGPMSTLSQEKKRNPYLR